MSEMQRRVDTAIGDVFDELFADTRRSTVIECRIDRGPDPTTDFLWDRHPVAGPRGGKPWSAKKAAKVAMQKRSRKANRPKRKPSPAIPAPIGGR